MYCRHDVADYAVWKKGYDDFAHYQSTHGVIMNQFINQPIIQMTSQ
jgi:hypothetical protein